MLDLVMEVYGDAAPLVPAHIGSSAYAFRVLLGAGSLYAIRVAVAGPAPCWDEEYAPILSVGQQAAHRRGGTAAPGRIQ